MNVCWTHEKTQLKGVRFARRSTWKRSILLVRFRGCLDALSAEKCSGKVLACATCRKSRAAQEARSVRSSRSGKPVQLSDPGSPHCLRAARASPSRSPSANVVSMARYQPATIVSRSSTYSSPGGNVRLLLSNAKNVVRIGDPRAGPSPPRRSPYWSDSQANSD